MTLHSQLLSPVRALSLARSHPPAPSRKRNQRSTTADLGSSLRFHPLHWQRPNLDCSPTTSPRALKPSIFLGHFSVPPTDADRGRIKVAWTMDWLRFSSLFGIHGEYCGQRLEAKECECRVAGPELCGFLAFSLRPLQQDQRSCFRPLNTREALVPRVLVIPPSLSSAGKVYDGFQLHRNINQPTRKEHPDDSKLAQDCTVRIVCRKGKSAPYREEWWEQWLVGQGATLCGCRCGDSGWIIEAMSVKRVAAIDHGLNGDKRAMYAMERIGWRLVERRDCSRLWQSTVRYA